MTAMIEQIAIALEALGLMLGAIVAYQAYRGYRRNQSRAMLALGIAIGLVAVGHVAVRPADWLTLLSDLEAEILTQLFDLVAVLLVGYALTRN